MTRIQQDRTLFRRLLRASAIAAAVPTIAGSRLFRALCRDDAIIEGLLNWRGHRTRSPASEQAAAVLIDAENVPARFIGAVLSDAANLGDVWITRAFADWSRPNLTTWRTLVQRSPIRAIHHASASAGRNACDIALTLDALDLLHTTGIRRFALVSSDSDFTGLALHLREYGCRVHGYGEYKTPITFTDACHEFTFVEELTNNRAATPTNRTVPNAPQPPRPANTAVPSTPANPLGLTRELRHHLCAIVASAAAPDGWAYQSRVAALIKSDLPDFDIRHYGHTKFGEFASATMLFDTRQRGAKPNKPPVTLLRNRTTPP